MNSSVNDFVSLVVNNHAIDTKDEMIAAVCRNFPMVKDGRALYHTDYFAVVFYYTKKHCLQQCGDIIVQT